MKLARWKEYISLNLNYPVGFDTNKTKKTNEMQWRKRDQESWEKIEFWIKKWYPMGLSEMQIPLAPPGLVIH